MSTFDTFLSDAISVIFGLFLLAIIWQMFAAGIKDMFADMVSMFRKRR